ncbi:MAG: SEC-C domain-containing protein, partial [Victivallales bacterium]|nr:SEC-C domain-containing protein [Victivallales bacterium]
HNVLNAKHHESEAEIVARAGQLGSVTIATNMAGRGTDIKLGPGVKEVGGLHVIGSERHDSRRIDRQLRGRCARQGDPGSSRFYVSLEDNLMRLFASDRVASIMDKMGMSDDDELSHPLLNHTIESSQRKVEQHHFAIRKHTLEYDDVMNKQRATIYGWRRKVLLAENTRDLLMDYIYTTVSDHVEATYATRVKRVPIDFTPLANWLAKTFPVSFPKELLVEEGNPDDFKEELDPPRIEKLSEELTKILIEAYNVKVKDIPLEAITWLERFIMLNGIDSLYQDHLYAMDALRQSVHLRSYGQRDPLVEYKQEAYKLFDGLMTAIKENICLNAYRLQPVMKQEEDEDGEQSEPVFVEPKTEKREMHTNQADLDPAFNSLLDGNPQQNKSQVPQASVTVKRQQPKIGRNDPCPCGSGKKYKNCCGK